MGKTATGQTMRSAERLLQVLSAFRLENPTRSISELSAELGLATSTVRRLVMTLERFGYLQMDVATGQYRPHFQMVRFASVAVAGFDLIRTAKPILDQLSDDAGEAIELTIRSGSNAVVVNNRDSKQLFRLMRPVGTVYPAYRGAAAGKILLAWMTEKSVIELLPSEGVWPGKVPQSITSKKELLAALQNVRKRGYATNIEETETDIWVVAAPVRDQINEVVAALVIPCLASRVSATERKRLTELVCKAADELTKISRLET